MPDAPTGATTDRHADERRALDLFEEAQAWPEEERADRLNAAAGPALASRVRRLLAAERHNRLLRTEPPEPRAPVAPRPPPERVGAYRLAERIGQGGMGAVYRGERTEGGFGQTVAIKLIPGGLFSAAAAERFAVERRILARLHHPHITRLFDGGVTPDGQSFIVMELIDGPPIDEAARGLPLAARLALFADVCAAIGYAHQQGIVHADIKPSNVLVDPAHGVKLVDFGISRMIAADDAETGRAATPAYASPQQRRGERVTPADDVFALGRLLDALCRTATDPELRAVIARAQADELEARYASAGALAEDVARWREGYPVRALPRRRTRDTRLFVRRNRTPVALAVAAVAGLIAAVVVSATLKARADIARAQAEQRFAEVRDLSGYLLTGVTDDLRRFPGTSGLRRDLAERGRRYLEALGATPDAPPGIRLEVAVGYAKTGQILGQPEVQSLGDPAAAKRDLARAEMALRGILAEGPNPLATLALARTLTTRADIARATDNDSGLAERLYTEAVALTAPAAITDGEARQARVDAWLGLARLFDAHARFTEMAAPLNAALAELRAEPSGAGPAARALAEAEALHLSGDAAYYLHGGSDALGFYERAAAVLGALPSDANDVRVLEKQAYLSFDQASVLEELGRAPEGLATIDQGVAQARLVRSFERSPRAWHMVNIVLMQRARILQALNRDADAIAQAEEDMAERRANAAANPGNFESVRSVPVGLRVLADVYRDAGDRAKACVLYAQTRDLWDRLVSNSGVTGFDATNEITFLDAQLLRCAK